MSPDRPRRFGSDTRRSDGRPQGKRDNKKSEWWSEKQGHHKKHGGHSPNEGPSPREKQGKYEPREAKEPREWNESRERYGGHGAHEGPGRGEKGRNRGAFERKEHGPRRENRPADAARHGDRGGRRFEPVQAGAAGFDAAPAGAEDETLWVVGRHEVAALLKANRPIESIVIAESAHGEAIREIREEAHRRRLKLQVLPVQAFRRMVGDDAQGVAAKAGAFEYTEFEALLDACEKNPEAILVALNHVEDPRNLGAVVRTVEAAGAAGIVIPRERAAAMTAGAIRTAQGAASHLPVAKVINLGVALENAKKRGFWIVGLDGEAPKRYDEVRYTGRVLLVAGGEDVGLGVRIGGACDECVSIPLGGKTPSLNVSVSTAVVLFEALRQKGFSVRGRDEK